MNDVKRLVEEQAEENLINMILGQARKNNMTILNIREITTKVISYLEANAILE